MPQPFKCPSCGGPLEYDGGDITVRCHYCTNHVIVPEELRPGGPSFNASSLPLPNQLANLAEIGRLIRAGNKIAAIKLYRETFGTGLKEAKDAVENLAAGRAVEVSRTIELNNHVHFDPQQMLNWFPPQAQIIEHTKKGCSLVFWGILVTFIAAAFGIGLAIYFALRPSQGSTPGTQTRSETSGGAAGRTAKTTKTVSGPASILLDFGGEGIGAGQFKDARSIAVDGNGHIYVGEYTGGRVQVFDADGKFLTQWLVDPKMPLLQLAADRQGTVYVVQSGEISRYEGRTGRSLGKVPSISRSSFTSDVTLMMDGGMVVVQRGENITVIDSGGQVVRTINAAISEQSGDSELSARVAVDGLGNIYAMGRFNDAVFKFDSNGKYITRFGGKGNQPGQFSALHAIAVDGQGRVFVGDSNGIQIFDGNGRYLDTIKVERALPFGLVFNDKNELFVASRTQVYKLAINKT